MATVITKDLSRLGRNYLKTGELIEIVFPEYEVRYIAINDGVDTARDDNELPRCGTGLMSFTPAILQRKSGQSNKQRHRKASVSTAKYPMAT